MRIAIATVQSPFIRGGAELHAANLLGALKRAGHEAEIVTMPFRYSPVSEIARSMALWEGEDFTCLNGYEPDMVICLKFPTWYLNHPRKVAWVLHQHRAVYDLWETTVSGLPLGEVDRWLQLRQTIQEKDCTHLRACRAVFANSKNVARRLERYNGVPATALYHPTPMDRMLIPGPPLSGFIFCPSRLECLKRQDLLIESLRYVQTPVRVLIVGEGPQRPVLEKLIQTHGLGERIRLVGRVDTKMLVTCYQRCLGVFYAPFDEDYGYVTLEAMRAGKPVITCTDSGGPLEFVRHGKTGLCVAPTPHDVARALDMLHTRQEFAQKMGKNAASRYETMRISWDHVLDALLGA